MTVAQAMRYSRHLMLPEMDFRGQEALLVASVLVVGMGGLGCAVAPYLVASGIGNLTLADDDMVDKTNLQRQILYTEADIGLAKAQQAVRRLQPLNTEIRLSALVQRLDAEQLQQQVAQYDLVLDCTDNLPTRQAINTACVQAKVPLVSGAAIRMEGQIASFSMTGEHGCYHCLSQYFAEQPLTCLEAGVLSPVVGVIGTMQALEAVKILSGVGTPLFGQLQLFNAATGQWRSFILPKDAACPVCAG
ncbi:molybdopterin-synthase adenylyltransferase MoeB [Chromatiaceae bacterium AAb-1]|nr:molybdopterin-synthase adenylyltransferase MoeB [Chromatiaceae bacterium AAb-1]